MSVRATCSQVSEEVANLATLRASGQRANWRLKDNIQRKDPVLETISKANDVVKTAILNMEPLVVGLERKIEELNGRCSLGSLDVKKEEMAQILENARSELSESKKLIETLREGSLQATCKIDDMNNPILQKDVKK